jgi:uncharacterized protein (TIGR03067 family)
MTKYAMCIGLATAMTLAALAADLSDTKSIEGSWAPVKGELGGRPIAEQVLKTISLKLTEGKYEVVADGHPDSGTYTLDSTTAPKAITVSGTDGPNKGKTFPCIYELHGDSLRICYDLSGRKRPTEFKSLTGTKLYLVTYNRK